jgi:hypothetical protein
MDAKFLGRSFWVALFAFAALLIFVFATGSTFGQRCAERHPNNPVATADCVELMASGLIK